MRLSIDPESVKGFLAASEGRRLYELALEAALTGPCLEVGSYCGKSTVYLGCACRERQQVLYAVDHHRGSEEHQPGEAYHDPELLDHEAGKMDSFRTFRDTLARADLENTVVPIVASSRVAGSRWQTALAMVFIDGGHSIEAATADFTTWAAHIRVGGILAIHDIFPDPADGGQAPYETYRQALNSGQFEALSSTMTLGVLRRVS